MLISSSIGVSMKGNADGSRIEAMAHIRLIMYNMDQKAGMRMAYWYLAFRECMRSFVCMYVL